MQPELGLDLLGPLGKLARNMCALALSTLGWPEHGLGDRARFFDLLGRSFALKLPAYLPLDACRRAALAVSAARAEWTSAFGDEQFSLGRAWYTHYEEDLGDEYFAHAGESNALVERCLPGMQQQAIDLIAQLSGGRAAARDGWCGPGVHVFPAFEAVARRGGVIHFDTEGLAKGHLEAMKPAITLLVMLQEPVKGGGIRLWEASWSGADHPTDAELERPSRIVEYHAGEALVFDSYRLHQIQPFSGRRDRLSLTAHAAEIDSGRWEVWF